MKWKYLSSISQFVMLMATCQGRPAAKPRDCARLRTYPQFDPRWDFETAPEAYCNLIAKDAYQHWKVAIPNDHIFDETRIRDRGASACGSSVFDGMGGTGCSAGFFSCSIDQDNIAYLEFTCARGTDQNAVSEGFHAGTCNAFPEVECKGF